MKFKYTILYVDDVVETFRFYEKAFGLKKKMLHESEEYGELDTGNTILAFSSLTLMKELGKNPIKPNLKAPTFEMAFETQNVNEALSKALEAGASLVQDATDIYGHTIAYVTENNGFLVEICTPLTSQA